MVVAAPALWGLSDLLITGNALWSLTNTQKQLETTQNRISTGFKVATATDNAAYWSIATTMRSDNKALSTVQDALGLGSAMLVATYDYWGYYNVCFIGEEIGPPHTYSEGSRCGVGECRVLDRGDDPAA